MPKKMKINNITLFAFSFLISLQVVAQNTTTYTFNNYILKVKESNPINKKSKNFGNLAKYQVTAARGNYDPQLNASFNNKFFDEKNYYSVAQATIKQPIFTSQYLKLGYEYGQGTFINPEEKTNSYALPFVGVEVSLLQGLLFDKNRADVLKSKAYFNYYKAIELQTQNDLLYDASLMYIDLAYAEKKVEITSFFRQLAQQRLDGIVQLAVSGERPSIDTVEAAMLLQGRVIELQESVNELQKNQNQLNVFITKKTTDATVINAVDSLFKLYRFAQQLYLNIQVADSLSNPIILQYKAKQNVLIVEQRLKKEFIKPKLDVSYNLLNNSNNILNVTSINNYKWGANLSFPLLFRASTNEFKIASLDAQNNQFELSNKQNELRAKFIYINNQITLLQLQINLADQSVKYGKMLVDVEQLKFSNGESSLFLVNTRENKLLENNLKLIALYSKYIQSVFNYKYLQGNYKYEL